VIVVALQSEREVIGTLAVGRAKGKNPRPFTPTEVRLLQGIAEMGGTAISRARLFHNLEDAYIQMVLALARAMDARDAYTGNHSERLAMLADSVARAMGLPDEEVKDIRWAALLHDIGKIGSPDDILSKPGRLTEREREIMRLHPTVGEGILLPVARMAGVARIVRHHQEKWDGTGYPDGLRGEAIPLGARILAVVDAYGAITDERPYKTPGTRAKAEAEIKRCAGTQFDPRVVDVFSQLLDRKEKETTLEFAGLSTRA
jgi:putative nucleotidyltransferase with HDIG domain